MFAFTLVEELLRNSLFYKGWPCAPQGHIAGCVGTPAA